ncbi:MAG: hypothetical protein LC112_11245 [Flavobacteriales bacterium]|nr:hypothetical protein [Flavobacteriales bacterium]
MKINKKNTMKNFENQMIGKADVNDCQLRSGDIISIEICKASANNAHGVVKTG